VPHDARLRLYLIGTLAESEAEALEDQYFDEPELLARLCDVEHDLLDDYAAGRLHGDELSAFERHWLSTKHLRACVVIARALRRLALERGAAPAPRRRLSPVARIASAGRGGALGSVRALEVDDRSASTGSHSCRGAADAEAHTDTQRDDACAASGTSGSLRAGPGTTSDAFGRGPTRRGPAGKSRRAARVPG